MDDVKYSEKSGLPALEATDIVSIGFLYTAFRLLPFLDTFNDSKLNVR